MANDKVVDWSIENVVHWLNSNGWQRLINIFIDYNIHHDRFLNLNMENVNDLLKNMDQITYGDKQRLFFSIQKLKQDQLTATARPRISIPLYNSRNSHSTMSSLSPTPLPTGSVVIPPRRNSSNFDISQYIPKRTSSNDSQVMKLLQDFQPAIKTPIITASNGITTDLSKLIGKRIPLPKMLSEDRRIQVTLDADTFIRLWIKQASNALDIKYAVLYKLSILIDNILDPTTYFFFYHENGIQSNVPLSDEELVYICQTSDDNRTNRVLVVPIEGYNLVRQQKKNYSRYSNNNRNDNNSYSYYYIISSTTSSTPSPISAATSLENPFNGIQLSDPGTPPLIDLSTAAAPHKATLSSNDLWAVTPATNNNNEARRPSIATTTGSSSSLASSTAQLWHVRPSTSTSTSTSTTTSNWPVEGISLYDPPTPKNDQSNVEFPTDATNDSSISATTETPPSPIESDKEDGTVMFGERPSVEKLYRDIDKYLPGHDLDKEILLETAATNGNHNTPANNIPPAVSKRLIGGVGTRQSSIRVVAKEAHQRWKQATNNVIVFNSLLRRKSTKMWDRPVERVKPGQENRIIAPPKPTAPTRAKSTATTTNDDITPTKMQWMRGNLIGRGSFGRVYHALNIATGDWLAVKQVDAAVTQSDRRNQDLQAAADALYREIRLLKDLDHENIVQYMGYDSNVEEGHIYIFLEYVPGGSISSLLSQYQYFDEPLTSFFTRQILCGLQYLHTRKILHRDIKAGNVLIDHDGVCKITDFGLSKNQNEGAYDPMANNSTMRGTVFWMAPEVLTNNYSAKVDVWSLGCTVLEMITGEHPWMELTSLAALYQIGKHNAPAIPTTISDEAKDFLSMCLKIQPEDRPTAVDLLQHPFVQPNPTFNFKESLKHQKPKEDHTTTPTQQNHKIISPFM